MHQSTNPDSLPSCLKVRNTGQFVAEITVEGQLQSMTSILQMKVFSDAARQKLVAKEAEWGAHKSSNGQELKRPLEKARQFQVSAIGRSDVTRNGRLHPCICHFRVVH